MRSKCDGLCVARKTKPYSDIPEHSRDVYTNRSIRIDHNNNLDETWLSSLTIHGRAGPYRTYLHETLHHLFSTYTQSASHAWTLSRSAVVASPNVRFQILLALHASLVTILRSMELRDRIVAAHTYDEKFEL